MPVPGQLVLIGDVDSAVDPPGLAATFGDWRPVAISAIAAAYQPSGPASLKLATPDLCLAAERQQLPLSDRSPDYPALLLANHVFRQGRRTERRLMLPAPAGILSYGAGNSRRSPPAPTNRAPGGNERHCRAQNSPVCRVPSRKNSSWIGMASASRSWTTRIPACSGNGAPPTQPRCGTAAPSWLLEQQRLGRRMTCRPSWKRRRCSDTDAVNTGDGRQWRRLLRVAAATGASCHRKGTVPPAPFKRIPLRHRSAIQRRATPAFTHREIACV